MTKAEAVNCEGLSTTLTFIRIKQALLTSTQQKLHALHVSVSKACDRNQLRRSLGQQADLVHFV